MKAFSLFSLLFATVTAASAALVGSGGVPTCTNEQVAYETYIGKDHNVKVSYSQCDEDAATAALAKRQSSNVCGAACNTFCFTPAGGPSASDCNVIADALLYDSQNVGVLFNVSATGTPTNKITMQYQTCLTYFLNQDFSTLARRAERRFSSRESDRKIPRSPNYHGTVTNNVLVRKNIPVWGISHAFSVPERGVFCRRVKIPGKASRALPFKNRKMPGKGYLSPTFSEHFHI